MQNTRIGNNMPSCSILFVEDNVDDFELIEHQLKSDHQEGLTIKHCDSLASALGLLKQGGIDIILLDLSLPDSQGIATVKEVRQAAPTVPIIVLSGTTDSAVAFESLKYGAEDYLLKDASDLRSLNRSINYALTRNEARASNERLATIVEASDDAIIGKTLNGTITSWNKGASLLFGYSAEEATGQSISMLMPTELSTEMQLILEAIAKGETIRNRETVRVNKSGERIDISATISPIRSSNGTISGAASIDRDITDRQKAQRILQESEERYRLLVAGVKDYAIYMLDANGLVESWNEGAKQIKGYEATEVIGQHFSIFYTAEERQLGLPEAHLKTAITTGRYEEQCWRTRKNGSLFYADIVIAPLFMASGELRGFTKITRDISERRLAQLEIIDARLRLSLALQAASVGVWDFDLVKNTVWRSLQHDEIFGHHDPVPDWNFEIFATYCHPEDREGAREAFKNGLETGDFRMQCRIVRANDRAVRWISVLGETFKNELGEPIRMMGTVADITDFKNQEEHKSTLALMNEREDFIATLTHDMKNPLMGANRLFDFFIAGNFGALSDQQLEIMQCLKDSNTDLLKLIADLMDVYRMEKAANSLTIDTCNLAEIITTCLNHIIPFSKLRSITITSDCPESLTVNADKNKLERVMQNLLGNALKFAPDGGTIKVRLLKSSENTIIEIEDNGAGIEPDELPRLFKRFSQGHAGQRYNGGTGLGLYLCKQIVEAHGGTIECTSEPNRFTIFRVTLPTQLRV